MLGSSIAIALAAAGRLPSGESQAAPVAPSPVTVAADTKWAPRVLKPAEHGVGRRVALPEGRSLSGTALPSASPGEYVVFALSSTTCPLSKKYVPTLVELAQGADARVHFVVVDPVATDSADSLRELAQRLGEHAALVHDRDGALARALGATTTTDVIVLDAAGTVVFHGAVDDQHGVGYSLERPRRRYLADALRALLAGEPMLVAATDAPGCELELARESEPARRRDSRGRLVG